MDALILFEACLQGRINHLSRRPYDRERLGLIQSGNVFIYEEYSSGIKRWTDGRHWSPSRVLGNFLVYRELRTAFLPGMTRKVMRPRRAPYSERRGSSDGQTDAEYALIGPLVDSYPFKPCGLVKKIIRVVLNGVPHHLVAYYTLEDVESGRLTRPSWDSTFCNIIPRPELVFQEGFRVPVDQEKDLMSEGSEWYSECLPLGAGDGVMPSNGGGSGGGSSIDMLYGSYADSAYAESAASRRPSLATISLDSSNSSSNHGHDLGAAADGFYTHGFYKSESHTPQFASMHHHSSVTNSPVGDGAPPPPPSNYYPLVLPTGVEPPPPPSSLVPFPSRQGVVGGHHQQQQHHHHQNQHHHQPRHHQHYSAADENLLAAHVAGQQQQQHHGSMPAYTAGYPICGGLGAPIYGDIQSAHGGQVFDLAYSVTVG